MKRINKYDAIIVGSGIGGLVCACYLAKAGMKILIIEKHHHSGGYCTSFKRKGYVFDSAVHSLRGVKEENELGIIFKDLKLKHRLSLIRIDPSDIIIYKNKIVSVYNDANKTIESFKSVFSSQQKQIEKFFSFLLNNDFVTLYKLTYRKIFKDLLDDFFADNEIKNCLNILLGNLGLDFSHISALSASVFLNELFKDGGYYPERGMQSFPDILVDRIKEYGGDVLFSSEVKYIYMKNSMVKGVKLKKGSFFESKIVVSNIDARRTYSQLIRQDATKNELKKRCIKLALSPSAFIVYLGIKQEIAAKYNCCTLWYFPSKRATHCYKEAFTKNNGMIGNYAICGLSALNIKNTSDINKKSISLTAISPWRSVDFWNRNKGRLSEKLTKKANEVLGISQKYIEIKEIATPTTLHRYTYNHNGALYGWASLPDQISKYVMPQKSRLKGLYLCGHWATRGWGQGGISMVANSGRTTADMILKSNRCNHQIRKMS